jgi:type IV secretory pathway VirB10-like protein
MDKLTKGTDPRTALPDDILDEANRRASPRMITASGFSPGLALGMVGIGLLGVVTFTTLTNQRTNAAKPPQAVTQPAVAPAKPPMPVVTPQPVPPPAPVVPPPPIAPMPPSVGIAQPLPPRPIGPSPEAFVAAANAAARLKTPALVVDLSKPLSNAAAAAADGKPGDKATDNVSADEKFAYRIADAESKPVQATRLSNTGDVVPQGAVVAAVLETAINSDLPGYVRAVVSRDVAGFDGRKILIPRGSRLIGQYRSGLTAGQSRAFVVWQRLIRPDGVSVLLGSPATDSLGRAGLGGQVDSHFLKRFGSAMLLSVVDAGLGRLQRRGGDIVVRSADDARNVAGSALENDINIPPTVKVPQGAPIRIFIARDLDFSNYASAAVK